MRAITRMRTLAALCALLMLLGSVPVSAFVEKPIDDPMGPPVVKPTEVGEPDPGHGMPVYLRNLIFVTILSHPGFRQLFLPLINARIPSMHSRSRGWQSQ